MGEGPGEKRRMVQRDEISGEREERGRNGGGKKEEGEKRVEKVEYGVAEERVGNGW